MPPTQVPSLRCILELSCYSISHYSTWNTVTQLFFLSLVSTYWTSLIPTVFNHNSTNSNYFSWFFPILVSFPLVFKSHTFQINCILFILVYWPEMPKPVFLASLKLSPLHPSSSSLGTLVYELYFNFSLPRPTSCSEKSATSCYPTPYMQDDIQ